MSAASAPGPRGGAPYFTVGLLCAASVAIAAFVHTVALYHGPFQGPQALMLLTPLQLRQHVGLHPLNLDALSFTQLFGASASVRLRAIARPYDAFIDFCFVIVLFFKQLLATQLGRGLLLLLLGWALPLVTLMTTEALRPGRNAVRDVLFLVFVTALGQFVCIGAATPLLYIPCFAHAQLAAFFPGGAPATGNPAPSPSRAATAFSLVCHTVTLAATLATVFVTPPSEHWLYANLAFQFFPLAYLPLVAWPVLRPFLSSGDTGAGASNKSAKQLPLTPAEEKIRASARARRVTELYSAVSILAIVLHTGALVMLAPYAMGFGAAVQRIASGALALASGGAPSRKALAAFGATVQRALVEQAGMQNDGEWLLIFDGFGLLASAYLVVLIDGAISAAYTRARTAPFPKGYQTDEHLEGVWALAAFIPAAIFLGPGFALATFLGAREERILAQSGAAAIAEGDLQVKHGKKE